MTGERTPEETLAEHAAAAFEELSYTGGLGKVSPRLAFSGIKAMSAHPAIAMSRLPELAALPDARAALTGMYMDARDAFALDRASQVFQKSMRESASKTAHVWAERLGVSAREAEEMLGGSSDDRAAVEARARMYRYR